MAKFVYLVRKGQFNSVTDKYEFYGIEAFSSHTKAKQYVDNVIECNKGYMREADFHYNACLPEDLRYGEDKLLHYQVDYKWRSEGDMGQADVKSRIVIQQKKLNYGF